MSTRAGGIVSRYSLMLERFAMRHCLLLSLSFMFFLGSLCSHSLWAQELDPAEQWGNFRGPTWNGGSETANPPIEWSESKNIKWKVELPGPGNTSSPIIWGDRVYVLSAEVIGGEERAGRRGRTVTKPTKFMVFCLDRETGETIWEQVAVEATPHEGHHPDHGYASASPFTDGDFLYAHFGSRGLFCYDLDGNLQWKRDDFGEMRTRGGFGEGSTPTLYGDTVLIPWDHEGPSALFALDRKSGETKWKVERDEPSNWSSPRVVEVDGKPLVVSIGQNFTRGYDLETGEERWRSSGLTSRPIATPVVCEELVMVASNRGGDYLGALEFGKSGVFSSDNGIAWSQQSSAPDVSSLLLSGQRLFYVKGNSNIFQGVHAKTGEPLFGKKRLPGIKSVYASPVAADGKIFVVGRRGNTVVLNDGDEFEVLAENVLDDQVDATPALAGSQIFLRGKRFLYCIEDQ